MSTTNPAFECELFTAEVLGLQVDDPLIIPTSVLALLVGAICGAKLFKSETSSHCLPFFGFAIMMSEAGIVHTCNRYFSPVGQEVMWFIDAALTSSIAMAFGCIALQDLGRLKNDKSFFGWFFLLDLPVVFGWYYAFFVSTNPKAQSVAFSILYFDLILVTCGLFGIVQLYFIIKGRFSGGLFPLMLACGAGYVGLKVAVSVCSWPDVRFSSEFWWFILSDVSMFYLYKYFKLRKEEE